MATDNSHLPDFDTSFVKDVGNYCTLHSSGRSGGTWPTNVTDMTAFARAISTPDTDLDDNFISALNDWRPVHQRIRPKTLRRRRRRKPGKDETREGFVYALLKWPLLLLAAAWLAVLAAMYVMTRFYISQYEYWITWRGERNLLRGRLRAARSYGEWCEAAAKLDEYLGLDAWKEDDAYAYYDFQTVRRTVTDLRRLREGAEKEEDEGRGVGKVHELRELVEMCVKNNFAGIESSRMYSQSYHGTKQLVQNFVDEGQWGATMVIGRSVTDGYEE